MTIPFDKRETQIECERIACVEQSLPVGSKEYKFEGLKIPSSNERKLRNLIFKDSVGFFFNACISFFSGIKSLINGSYSWGTVQLYYSVYYSCRGILGFDRNSIIRKDRKLYLLSLISPITIKRLSQGNDHLATIDAYVTQYKGVDFLSSNLINDLTFYQWIRDCREITNYRQRCFLEPDSLPFLVAIIQEFSKGESIKSILDKCAKNWDLYCFQEEYALIAGPYRLLIELSGKYKMCANKLDPQQDEYITALINNLKLRPLY